jgi:hypothetical protein
MYVRLAFWTLAMAYTSVLLSRGTGGSSAMFVNRRTRKRG